jgi:hypothetical protein
MEAAVDPTELTPPQPVPTQPGIPTGAPPPGTIVPDLVAISGWTRFIAVLGFIGMGIMVLMGLVALAVGLPGMPAGRLLGLLYLGLAGIYLVPLLPLNRLSSAASRLRQSPGLDGVAEVLHFNRLFWSRLGILSVIYVAVVGVGLIVALLIGVLAAARG